MKFFRFLFVCLLLNLFLTGLDAFGQSKVASVDMRKLFNGYYKTKLAEDLLDKDKALDRKNLKEMADQITAAQADYQHLLDQANDQAISDDSRQKIKQSAADKAQQINDSKAAFDKFQREVESTLEDKTQRMTGNLVSEIQQAVSDKAKLGGYSLVVNSSSSEVVVYASPDIDITASVLSELNAGAPEVVPGADSTASATSANTNASNTNAVNHP